MQLIVNHCVSTHVWDQDNMTSRSNFVQIQNKIGTSGCNTEGMWAGSYQEKKTLLFLTKK